LENVILNSLVNFKGHTTTDIAAQYEIYSDEGVQKVCSWLYNVHRISWSANWSWNTRI